MARKKMSKKKKRPRNKNTDFKAKYYDLRHPTSFAGKKTFADSLKSDERESAKNWLESEIPYQIHKPVKKKFKRQKILAQFQYQVQGDLVDVSKLAKYNSGVKYLFTVIDCFSRKAEVEPILNKTATTVTAAFEKILSRLGYLPLYFNSDQGGEFVNATFKKMLKKHNILFFTSLDKDIKCSLVERFNRTIMTRIYRFMTKNNTYRFLDVLPNIIDNYNQTPHSSIGIAPAKVSHKNKEQVWAKLNKKPHNNNNKTRFIVGDYVLIPKNRKNFSKSL